MTELPDYRTRVTQDIIRLLEEGTAPWQKPWQAGPAGSMPFNPTTGKPYRGGNVIALMVSSMRHGFDDPRWMTYKQAAEKSWQVLKGEKGTQIEFWEARPGNKAEGADDEEKRSRLIHRVYTVFNGQQIDGLPPMKLEPRKPFEVIEAGETILKNSGAQIRHGGDRAYYTRQGDYIQLPHKEQFTDAPSYYGVACHELTHWTGNENRLNRETLTKSRGYNPQDEHYAREELVAEIGSMMLAAETGIPHNPERHAAYVASWLEALKKNKNEIFRAASAASKACDYILAPEKVKATGTHVEGVEASRPASQLAR